jgi:hypothetical protein
VLVAAKLIPSLEVDVQVRGRRKFCIATMSLTGVGEAPMGRPSLLFTRSFCVQHQVLGGAP